MAVFGAKEWAEHSFNCINGCAHNCRYCYAKKIAVRYGRKKDLASWPKEERIEKLDKIRKFNGRVMIPSPHDITPSNYAHVFKHLRLLLEKGNSLLIVSKPHFPVISSLCKEFKKYKDKIYFRFSIGSANSQALKFWEPGAPSFDERLESLKYAYDQGFSTSVSSEPILFDDSDDLIRLTLPFVSDSLWLGKMNNHKDISNLYTKTLFEVYRKENILSLYSRYKNNKKIKWKESIKKVVGLHIPEKAGLDI